MQVRYQLRQRPDGVDDTTATGVNRPPWLKRGASGWCSQQDCLP